VVVVVVVVVLVDPCRLLPELGLRHLQPVVVVVAIEVGGA